MAAGCMLAGSWDLATYGSVGTVFTTTAGTFSTATYSSGKYEHGVICAGAGVATPALSQWAATLAADMSALTAPRTITITWSQTTGLYTVGVDSGNLSLTWSSFGDTSASDRLRKLLGFSGNKSGSPSYTSDYVPWFALKPAIAGLTNDSGVTRRGGASKSATSATGTRYVMQPTSIPRVRTWEHHFEPKERVDRDYLDGVGGGTHLYTFENLWSDYGTATMPIGASVVYANGRTEIFAFSLDTPEYDRSVLMRMRPNDDVRFKVHVEATLWPTTANSYARVIS